MSLKSRLVKFVSGVEDLFLSNHACICCRREILDGTPFSLCENCLKNLEKIDGTVCTICGEEVLKNNMYCDRCKTQEYEFDASRSYAYYGEVASRIVKRFKYNGKKYYAEYIANLMIENDAYFENVDYITFVPIGKKRRKERGFNQAEEIAKIISKKLDIPLIDTLEKCGSERHQAGLSQTDRMKNLSGTFMLKEGVAGIIKNKNVLIIDDVFTTGATLSECAKSLITSKRNKPSAVFCYTFAKTKFNFTKTG